MKEDNKIKIVKIQAGFKGSVDYQSCNVSFEAEVGEEIDNKTVSKYLMDLAQEVVAKKLSEIKKPSAESVPKAPSQEELKCENCSKVITPKVNDYSSEHFGRSLCMDCQKEAKKIETK